MAQFTVFVDDNFNYMDEDRRYKAGTFASYAEAVEKAKQIIDGFLTAHYKPGMTPEDLYTGYRQYGDDPFIDGDLSQEVRAETVAIGNALTSEINKRMKNNDCDFKELNKPVSLPQAVVRFSAWDYAEKRCKELCRK